ncbi:MAG: hypothetical protein ACJ8LG_14855 [Massilia sp.]
MINSYSRTRRTRILTALLLSSAAASAWAWEAGRMTGGGSIICKGPAYRVTFGYELHCQLDKQPISTPNNLEVNFSTGTHFHLTALNQAECSGQNTTHPDAGFNQIAGFGTGRLDGQPARIEFKLVDNAEPGAGADQAFFRITTGSNNEEVLNCGPTVLEGGNNQAHRATGNKQ